MATAKNKNLNKSNKGADLDKRLANLEASIRICQLMIQQMGKAVSSINADMEGFNNRQRSIQYRLLAAQNTLQEKFPGVDVVQAAEELQIKDFDEASDREDVEKKYEVAETVEEDSVVIITTKADVAAKSISRSKFELEKVQVPNLKEALLGKKSGESFECEFGDAKHQVTVLGVRNKPEEAKVEEVQVQAKEEPQTDVQ